MNKQKYIIRREIMFTEVPSHKNCTFMNTKPQIDVKMVEKSSFCTSRVSEGALLVDLIDNRPVLEYDTICKYNLNRHYTLLDATLVHLSGKTVVFNVPDIEL